MTQASRRRILLCWAVLVGLSAWGQPLNNSVTIPNGDNWFDHPDMLCAALQPLGYLAGSWGQIRGSPVHNCVYPPIVRTSDTPAAIDAMLATAQPPAPLSLDLRFRASSRHKRIAFGSPLQFRRWKRRLTQRQRNKCSVAFTLYTD